MWGDITHGGSLVVEVFFHRADGKLVALYGTDDCAAIARVLACAPIMRWSRGLTVPEFGHLPRASFQLPRVSDDVDADMARLQRAVDHVFNGGDAAEVL